MQERATEIISQATDQAAKMTAEYIQLVIIHFFQTPIGMLIILLVTIYIAFKFWNWGIRDRSRWYIKKVAERQKITYDQQTQILEELKWVNKAIQPKQKPQQINTECYQQSNYRQN